LRQTLSAHPGTRGAEQLKQASLPQDVEICGVGVKRVFEFIARLTCSDPAVFHAGQAAAIHGCGALGHIHGADHAAMDQHESDKENDAGD
jgi:hypothetical protein